MSGLTVHVAPDGPITTVDAALEALRAHREPGQPATVLVAPGTYRLRAPVLLRPEDSQTTVAGLDPTDPPVLDGAVELARWSETEVNGVTVWASHTALAARSLFVGGERRPRPRLPREGLYRIAEQPGLDLDRDWLDMLYAGSDRFRYHDGDVWPFHDLTAVEAVVPHYWVQERMPLAAVDPEARLVVSDRRSIFALRDDIVDSYAPYYLDNVFEAFGQVPGEWYADRQRGRVLYAPRPADRLAEMVAHLPAVDQFVVVAGRPARGEFVRGVRLENIVFRHADWRHPSRAGAPFGVPQDSELPAGIPYASAPQAAANVDAALEFVGARECAVVDCRIERVGGYAVELGEGCQDDLVSGTVMLDLGAGGVRLHGAAEATDPAANRRNEVSDCEISVGGQVFPQAVGILARHSAYNVFAHNHVHHLYYSGISAGWVWGYGDNPARGNLIAHNHIHHLGQGRLNDMGGVYLLGEQPGTAVRGNLIHDIECAHYGGWGIYLDEGASHVVVEANVCHDVSSQCLHQNFGRENTVRHNVFAWGRRGLVLLTCIEDHVSFTLERNILVTDGSPSLAGTAAADVRDYRILCDLNLYWDVAGPAVMAGNLAEDGSGEAVPATQWRRLGHDRHSVVADPGLDVARRRFARPAGTAADALAIPTPDLSRVGIRPPEQRHRLQAASTFERRVHGGSSHPDDVPIPNR